MADLRAGPEIHRVANALRDIDKSLPAKLRKDLRKAATPIVQKAKANAKSIEVNTADQNHIRRAIARGVGVQVSTGKKAKIRIVTKMPERSQAIIPRGFNSPKGFRHPVFGNREVWVNQIPKKSDWFFSAVQEGKPVVQLAVIKTLNDAARTVARNGKRTK